MMQAATEHTTTSKASQNGGTSFIPPVVIQKKLEIGEPDDQYEIEADRMADMVVQMKPIDADKPKPTNTIIQRKCSNCEEEERIRKKSLSEQITPLVQRKTTASAEGTVASSAISSKINSSKGGGSPLSKNTRHAMESGFGTNFSKVRVHTDANAVHLSRELNAQAFTVGNDIYFNEGKYNPNSHSGKHLLAHELTHTVQQSKTKHSRLNTKIQRQDSENEEVDYNFTHEPIIDIPSRIEPRCPRRGTRIGYVTPSPTCSENGNHIIGRSFEFCRDSDIFSDPSTPSQIQTFVQSQLSQTSFKIRTYSSNEGRGTDADRLLYNQNLACHRLKRTIRELLNSGVRRNRIEAISMGPTERFGQGLANRARNRVAVIQANPPNLTVGVNINDGNQRRSNEEIKDSAIQRLSNGNYNLGADAYLNKWTCGRFVSLSQAVSRVNVNISGSWRNSQNGPNPGTISRSGINSIDIPSWVFEETTNPVQAVACRIIDLTFHHFARPALPLWTHQHAGGQYLVHLAGFSGFQIRPDQLRTNFFPSGGSSLPNSSDPMPQKQPQCADLPLSGSMGRNRQNRFSPVVNFQSPPLIVNTGSGSLTSWRVSGPSIFAFPSRPMNVFGQVTSTGDPDEMANYEIGFLQTIMDEDYVMTYVDGRRINKNFPFPLRDGDPRDGQGHDPPWYGREAHASATSNLLRINMGDLPDIRGIRVFPSLGRTQFVQSQDTSSLQTRRDYNFLGRNNTLGRFFTENRHNALDSIYRKTYFNTWVVARHNSAPLTIDSTHFIQGVRMELTMNSNHIFRNNMRHSSSGTFSLTSRPAQDSDKNHMRLRGATPKDFRSNPMQISSQDPFQLPLLNELLSEEGPISSSGLRRGLNTQQLRTEIDRISRPFRTNDNLRNSLIIKIRIDENTGRVLLPEPGRNDSVHNICWINGHKNDRWAKNFVEAIFPEVRKLVVNSQTRLSRDNTSRIMHLPLPVITE